MLQDIDFEKMSYAEGLAMVAAQRPFEKQAINFEDIKKSIGDVLSNPYAQDIKKSIGDVLSNPYAQYGLAGAGVGGLGGLASTLFKKKRRRNYLRDILTGSVLGGAGGLATRGLMDAYANLSQQGNLTTLDKTKAREALAEAEENPSLIPSGGLPERVRSLLPGSLGEDPTGFAPETIGKHVEDKGRLSQILANPAVPIVAAGVGEGLKRVTDARTLHKDTMAELGNQANQHNAGRAGSQGSTTHIGTKAHQRAVAKKLYPEPILSNPSPSNIKRRGLDYWNRSNLAKVRSVKVKPHPDAPLVTTTTGGKSGYGNFGRGKSPVKTTKSRGNPRYTQVDAAKNYSAARKNILQRTNVLPPEGAGLAGRAWHGTKRGFKGTARAVGWNLLPMLAAILLQNKATGYTDAQNAARREYIQQHPIPRN